MSEKFCFEILSDCGQNCTNNLRVTFCRTSLSVDNGRRQMHRLSVKSMSE